MKIFKFGGSVLNNIKSFEDAHKIIKYANEDKIIIILSAISKNTSQLEYLFKSKIKNNTSKYSLNFLKKHLFNTYYSIIGHFDSKFKQKAKYDLQNWYNKLKNILDNATKNNHKEELDKFLSLGEIGTSIIFNYFLQSKGIRSSILPAVKNIKTNSNYGDAEIDLQKSKEILEKNIKILLEKNNIILIEGYIGSNDLDKTTTLGKEGSDYTAAAIAYMLNSTYEVIFWKNVPGIMDIDPKNNIKAKKIDFVYEDDILNLINEKSQIIHYKALKLLLNNKIQFSIKDFNNPTKNGTQICYKKELIQKNSQTKINYKT